MSAPIFLFDISAYLHRAMYVCYGDRCADIAPTDDQFIRHACGMLANTMDKLNVKRMVVACDSVEPSFRCDYFPAYKAERKAHYPVFSEQAPRFFAALAEMSVAVFAEPRYEADDVIASISRKAVDRSVIVSSDKDMFALIREHTYFHPATDFFDPMKSIWVKPENVMEKFGVTPAQLYDYTGLVGDASDGIPGVEGIGAKTAAKLLREFGSLDAMYEREQALAEFASKKQAATLHAQRDAAFMSRKLAQPVPCTFDMQWINDSGAFDAPASGIVRMACG